MEKEITFKKVSLTYYKGILVGLKMIEESEQKRFALQEKAIEMIAKLDEEIKVLNQAKHLLANGEEKRQAFNNRREINYNK